MLRRLVSIIARIYAILALLTAFVAGSAVSELPEAAKKEATVAIRLRRSMTVLAAFIN